jgi:hypothetical protein
MAERHNKVTNAVSGGWQPRRDGQMHLNSADMFSPMQISSRK